MSDGVGAALRRAAKVLVAYAVGAALLWSALPAIARTFLLPELFGVLARGALVLGVGIAVVVAWRYPRMGVGGGPEDGSP